MTLYAGAMRSPRRMLVLHAVVATFYGFPVTRSLEWLQTNGLFSGSPRVPRSRGIGCPMRSAHFVLGCGLAIRHRLLPPFLSLFGCRLRE